jgi:hypothetical protein
MDFWMEFSDKIAEPLFDAKTIQKFNMKLEKPVFDEVVELLTNGIQGYFCRLVYTCAMDLRIPIETLPNKEFLLKYAQSMDGK